MKFLPTRISSAAAIVTAAVLLGACASAPTRNVALDAAKASYDRAAADTQVVRSAPVELRKAQQALLQAETAQRSGEDAASVSYYADLAAKRTEVAVQAGKLAQADQAMAASALQRDRILIDSRTREADTQRAMAEQARMQADTQRGEAEAARKLAEERLAVAQSSQAQTVAAKARAKSLEEQLAEMKAKPTDRGMVLTLGDVLFDTGRAELNPGAARSLDQLVTFLKANDGRSVKIEGFTDSVGADALNQMLSERRAIAVKNALLDRGIPATRVAARGFGEANPVASNDTAAGRQQNRRVEIVISDAAK